MMTLMKKTRVPTTMSLLLRKQNARNAKSSRNERFFRTSYRERQVRFVSVCCAVLCTAPATAYSMHVFEMGISNELEGNERKHVANGVVYGAYSHLYSNSRHGRGTRLKDGKIGTSRNTHQPCHNNITTIFSSITVR
jgi:hypothetical protein